MEAKEVVDIYYFCDKTMYRIFKGDVIHITTFQEHPLLLWDKENCCLADMSDITFIAERKRIWI